MTIGTNITKQNRRNLTNRTLPRDFAFRSTDQEESSLSIFYGTPYIPILSILNQVVQLAALNERTRQTD